MLRNTQTHYGWVSITLHWLIAVAVFALFAAGVWMVELNYYSAWYKTAPHWHKSVGILVVFVMFARLLWRYLSVKPAALASHSRFEIRVATLVQLLLYVGIFVLFISGYLISTADGRPIAVFNWFELPSAGQLFAQQADIAGAIHQYTAYGLISLALLHAVAALKHHFIDKDHTLKRMFGVNTTAGEQE